MSNLSGGVVISGGGANNAVGLSFPQMIKSAPGTVSSVTVAVPSSVIKGFPGSFFVLNDCASVADANSSNVVATIDATTVGVTAINASS